MSPPQRRLTSRPCPRRCLSPPRRRLPPRHLWPEVLRRQPRCLTPLVHRRLPRRSALSPDTVVTNSASTRGAILKVEDLIAMMNHLTGRQARVHLNRIRNKAAFAGEEVRDLTCETWWRRVIAPRPQYRGLRHRTLGGPLRCYELNRRKLGLPPLYGEHRFDFVAVRTDGSAVPLHFTLASAKPPQGCGLELGPCVDAGRWECGCVAKSGAVLPPQPGECEQQREGRPLMGRFLRVAGCRRP